MFSPPIVRKRCMISRGRMLSVPTPVFGQQTEAFAWKSLFLNLSVSFADRSLSQGSHYSKTTRCPQVEIVTHWVAIFCACN